MVTRSVRLFIGALLLSVLAVVGPTSTGKAEALSFCFQYNTDYRVSAWNDYYKSTRKLVWGCKDGKVRPGYYYRGNWPVWQFKDVVGKDHCLHAYYRTGIVSVSTGRHAYNYRNQTTWTSMHYADCTRNWG